MVKTAELRHFYLSSLSCPGTSIMRRMKPRQAILDTACITFLFLIPACSTPKESFPTQTALPATPTQTATIPPSPVPATPTPLTCLTEPGRVEQNVLPA